MPTFGANIQWSLVADRSDNRTGGGPREVILRGGFWRFLALDIEEAILHGGSGGKEETEVMDPQRQAESGIARPDPSTIAKLNTHRTTGAYVVAHLDDAWMGSRLNVPQTWGTYVSGSMLAPSQTFESFLVCSILPNESIEETIWTSPWRANPGEAYRATPPACWSLGGRSST